jgi:hypothetical protein
MHRCWWSSCCSLHICIDNQISKARVYTLNPCKRRHECGFFLDFWHLNQEGHKLVEVVGPAVGRLVVDELVLPVIS